MAGEVAGFTPDHEVSGSKRSKIRRTILGVTFVTLVGLAIIVAVIVTQTASESPGLVVYPDNVIILEGRSGETSKQQHYADVVQNLLDSRDGTSTPEFLHECSFWTKKYADKQCMFSSLWVCEGDGDNGFLRGNPCLLLQFNEPKDWVPEPYTDLDELPAEMPQNLRDHISDMVHENPYDWMKFLWVSCSGVTPADEYSLGEAKIGPWHGFPLYYFPVRDDTDPHAVPLLDLRFPAAERGMVLGVNCYFWAKNLKTPHVAARIELLL